MTDFDRQVLSLLERWGGWNARTRGLLLALASAHGVTETGLLKVIAGLYEYTHAAARRGGEGTEAVPQSPAPAPAWDMPGQVFVQPRHRTAVSAPKMSILFGLLTVLAAAIIAHLLLEPVPPRRQAATAPALAPATPTRALTEPPSATAVADASSSAIVPAAFARRPTFQGQALSGEVASAADSCRRVAGSLGVLARKLEIAGDPSEAVYREWQDLLQTVASGWVLVDEGLLEEIHRSIVESLFAASDSPSVTDRLLRAIVPPPGRRLEPVDVWRGAWMCGTLARVARSRNASAAVVEAARAHLEEALGGDPGGDFNEAAGAWLDRAAANLVEITDRDPQAYDLWESWIAAQRRLGRGERLQRAVMNAIELILTGASDLARPGPAVDVLGRLLTMADFRGSAAVRQRLLGFFDDQQNIGSRDLWVLTSLLAADGETAWFGSDLIVPEDADWLHRRRAADRIAQRWPQEASAAAEAEAAVAGVPVEPELAASWLEALHQLEAQESPRSAQRLERLVAASRINAAAVRMAFGDQPGARQQLLGAAEPLAAADASPAPGPARPVNLATPPGTSARDGEFSVAWEQAGHNLEDRMKLLRSLRDTAGSDLGPLDADTLVHIVYRGTPPELRELAADVLLEKFTGGVNVALEMLDQLPGATASTLVADTLSRFTGKLLPTVRSESWRAEARLALVERNLDLRNSADRALDRAAEALGEACDSARGSMEPGGVPSRDAVAAAEALVEAWRKFAARHESRRAVPASLVELERRDAMRRRLADGPVQRFVAAQIAILDLMAYVAAARDPALRDPVGGLLRDSAAARQRSIDVLDQAVEAAMASARLWAMQVTPGPHIEQTP